MGLSPLKPVCAQIVQNARFLDSVPDVSQMLGQHDAYLTAWSASTGLDLHDPDYLLERKADTLSGTYELHYSCSLATVVSISTLTAETR